MITLLVMKCLKQTFAHPLYWMSCMPVEGKKVLVTVYVDMFLFIFNMHVIALHGCVALLHFKTRILSLLTCALNSVQGSVSISIPFFHLVFLHDIAYGFTVRFFWSVRTDEF